MVFTILFRGRKVTELKRPKVGSKVWIRDGSNHGRGYKLPHISILVKVVDHTTWDTSRFHANPVNPEFAHANGFWYEVDEIFKPIIKPRKKGQIVGERIFQE